ncbi:hypothetical protein V6N13_001709 [Hibiscus sabdariffa]
MIMNSYDDMSNAYIVLECMIGQWLDVEDDVSAAAVAKLGLVDDQHLWGYVQPEPNIEDVWTNAVARMRLEDEQPVWDNVQPEPNQT